MGYKRSYLTAFAFLGALTFNSQTLNCGPLIAAGSTVEVEIQADIDSGVDDENFNEGETTPSLESEVNIGDEVESEQSPNSEHGEYENTLPASLARAVLVGAQRRSHEINNLNREDKGELSSDEVTSQEEISEERISSNSKPQLTGCVWGSVGCNKGKRNTGTNPTGSSINSSTVIEPEEDALDTPSTSVFSGSATAKIKAHVEEARGVSSNQRDPLSSMKNNRTRLSSSNTVKGTDEAESKHKSDDSHKPPQGFELSGRIVTSPGDGLVSYLPLVYTFGCMMLTFNYVHKSYFLDAPEDPNALKLDNWMMNIPYTYVECGPTVESTTESFLLDDMVVRHFPHGAAMGHWINLAGGVTIEKSKSKTEEIEESYISDNIDGHPKLLVALTPIEITVSGNDEETRTFYPGEVVLMEDTMGKGHKMRAARGESDDMKILMVSLPHSVHHTISDFNDYATEQKSKSSSDENVQMDAPSDQPPSSSYPGAKHSIFGLTPRRLSRERTFRDYRTALNVDDTKPCPLEYDSAYSSLFTQAHQRRRSGRRRKRRQRRESAFSREYPPPPGHSTYDEESVLLRFLPSLRRTMLFGIGLSLTSAFVYCVQLIYPPLLVLIGSSAFVMGGALINVLGTRWSYRQWLTVWEEEWRWRRELKRQKEAKREREDSLMTDGEAIVDESTQTTHDSINEPLDSAES